MANPTPAIDVVHAAAMDARGWAHGASVRQLRRCVRRLRDVEHDFYNPDYARLMAYRHELADRGIVS